jgi:dynein heavy chain
MLCCFVQISYQFTENDLNVCVTQLRDFLDMYDEVPVALRTLHFLFYDINYGGRVTDDIDRRTIRTILDDFMNEQVLSDEYVLAGKYTSIATGTREHYLKHIQTMDVNPEPDVFGLHENANITSAQEDTNVLFQTILALLPRSSGGTGKSREQQISEAATSILERVPQAWEVESVQKKFPTDYSESFNTVVVQEVIRYNRLLLTLRGSLEDLLRALKGEMVMSESLEQMAASLFTNQVPEAWVAVAYPSLMPLAAWVSDLLARVTFIENWIQNGTPVVFWISGFFFPQAFLTGTLQNYARKYKKPIDSVTFSFHVLGDRKVDAIVERPRDGIYIHGLHLEGARWDTAAQSLVDSKPKELFTPFPVMWLLPEEEPPAAVGQEVAVVNPNIYRCPVYKILTRRGTLSTTGHSTNFIIFVDLPTKESPSKWIKASVALFCALRY